MAQVKHDYRSFVGLGAGSVAINWSRVGCLPAAPEIGLVLASGCKCALDPMLICPVHVCRCKECNLRGVKTARCAWRQHACDYLMKKMPNLLNDPQEAHKMTYCQVADYHGGSCLPKSARERNMLNIISRLPKTQPLDSTVANLDISQAIHLTTVKTDGTVATMATGAVVFSLRDAMVLSVPMMAKLMGRDVTRFSNLSVSGPQYKRILGMSFHPACTGLVLAGFLASIADGSG